MVSRTSKAIKGLIASAVQLIVLIVLQAILAPTILKIAGQEVLGAYSVVMQVIGYGLILDFGLSVALSRYLAQSFSAGDYGVKFKKIFNIGQFFILATNTLLFIFLLTLAHNVDSIIVNSDEVIGDARAALYILAAWTILRTPLSLYGHALLASQNMAAANIASLIGGVGRLMLSISFVYCGWGLIGLVLANIISEFLVLALQKIYFNKAYPHLNVKWSRPDAPLLKELFRFGMMYWGVNLAAVLTIGSDSIIVGNIFGAATVSIFYTTKIPSFLITQFIYKISDNAAPAVNELISQANFNGLRSSYLKILRYSLLLVIPVAIGIIGFNEEFIKLWVGKTQYAGNIMSFSLACFAITQVINHINAMFTLAIGDMRKWMLVSIITGVMTIGSAYLLGKNFGMQWVMVAIAVMDLPIMIFLMQRSYSGIGMTSCLAWREGILPPIMVGLPLFVVILLIKELGHAEGLFNMAGCIFIFSLIWIFSLYAFGINENERIFIRTKISLIY